MAIRKQPDEQAILFFGGMNNAQAAQSMLAWRLNRDVFAPMVRKAVKRQPAAKEQQEECCCMEVCMQEAK